MKRRAVLPLVVLVLLGNAAVSTADAARPGGVTIGPDVGAAGGEEVEEAEEAEARGAPEPGPAGADQFFTAQRLYPYTRPLTLSAAYRAAQEQSTRVAQSSIGAAAAWQPLGPSNIGGRVTDIVVDPVRTDTVYAGAATGGVWRSVDGGRTFNSAWPTTITPSIGALAITPAGTLYAGTGEGNPGGGSVTFPGNGVYRSTDGGSTWTPAGLAGSDRIGRLAIDPTNPNRIFAAATGSLFVPGGVRGLYRTTDAGATWQLVLPGGNGTTGAIDVAIDPHNPNRVFAAMWDHKRQPEGRTYGGVGSGLFRSTDGGTTWTRVAGGLPAASSNLGRMGVAIAPGNSNRMYAIAADTTGNFAGFWTSTNGGTAWTRITNTSFLSASQSTYGWWFGRIWVDAAAEQHVWVAGVQILESSNAGGSWTRNTAVHADQHAFAFDPRVAGRVFLAGDGGVYRSTSNGSLTGTWTKATSLGINQFYTVAVSRQDTARVSGGAQDNGSLRNWSGTAFNAIGGGDGTTNLIDPTNQNKVYSCSQNGACTRSTDGGTTRSGFGSTVSDRRNWVTPIVFDPNNPAIMYYAGNRVNRSTNSAASWTAISPDLTRGNGGISGAFGTVTTLAVARSDSRVIYAGTDDGRAWITRNTGSSWTEITAGLPTRWITHIDVDPANANIAYLSVSGYRSGDSGAHVFKTTTGGTGSSAWQDISAGLPDAPVNDVVLDPRNSGVLYAATDVGVFARTGGVWARVGSGLPLVPVADLDAVAAGSTTVLTAATYGLGFYRTTA
jgi:hypothetical protein